MRRAALLLLSGCCAYSFPNPDGPCNITTAPVQAQTSVDRPSTYTFSTSGCTLPIKFVEVATGSLPPGLTLSPVSGSGITLSGTPTTAGSYAFALRFLDSSNRFPSKTFVIKVNPALKIDMPALGSGQTGVAYQGTLFASGGMAPYVWSIASGSLPAGVSLDPVAGELFGTMGAASGTFILRATDALGSTADKAYSIFPSNARILNSNLPSNVPTGSVGSAYSFKIDSNLSATGFAVALGSLPVGLSMASDGQISGTPGVTGIYHFVVRCTSGLQTVWKHFRIAVNAAGGITSVPRSTEFQFAYDDVLVVSGGVAPYTFAVTTGSLPPGIALDASSGALYGEFSSVSTGGPPAATITATDATGRAYTGSVTIPVVPRLNGTASSVGLFRVGTLGSANPYSLTDGQGPFSFRIIGGSGDEFLFLNTANGSSTPLFTTPGTFTPVVMATDALGGAFVFTTPTYTAVGPLSIGTTVLANALSGASYTQIVIAGNAIGSVTWAVTGGALPPGLNLNTSTGVISGTTDVGGPHNFTITATDSTGQTASRLYQINVGSISRITTTFIPQGTISSPYSVTFAANPSVSSFTLTGAPPPGLSLSGSGTLSGTPTTAGTYSVTVNADVIGYGTVDTKTFTLYIAPPVTFSLSPASTLETSVGFGNQALLQAAGGRGPYTYFVTGGTLPEGLFVDRTLNVIRGTAKRTGTNSFQIGAVDADGRVSPAVPYTIVVREPITTLTSSLPNPTRTIAYNQTVAINGGRAPYTFSIGGGSLPPGLSLDPSTGAITGLATTLGNYSFDVLVSDPDGRGNELTYSVIVRDPLVNTGPSVLSPATLLSPYTNQITAAGGSALAKTAVIAGDVPPLLELDNGGFITKLPVLAGVFNFTVEFTDTDGRKASKAHSITVGTGFTITTVSLPNGTTGVPYSQTINTSNGIAPLSFISSAGVIPNGLVLNQSTGVLSGTPTTTATFDFAVTASDSASQSVQQFYTVIISNPLQITTASLPAGTVSLPYNQTITVTGGRAPIAFLATGLPQGLAINSGGVISGTPGATGVFPILVSVSDADGRTTSRSLDLIIGSGVTISPASLPSGLVSTPYAVTLTATGNSSPVTWTIIAGSLPGGITLNPATGLISGTATQAASTSFTVQASNTAGDLGIASYSLAINGLLTISPSTLPAGIVGTNYGVTFTATGGALPITWSVITGSLPGGLTLNASSGQLSGSPTASGSFPFTIRASGSGGEQGTAAYTLVINTPLSITPPTLPDGVVGTPYSAPLAATGAGSATLGWSITAGTLPGGLSLNANTGAITGTPTTAGSFAFTVNVAVLNSAVAIGASRDFTILVSDPLVITTATLPDGTEQEPYTAALAASGGSGSGYQWAVAQGALPPGLTLNAGTGAITGTPTLHGSYPFTARVTDSRGNTITRAMSLTVVETLVILTSTLGDATQNRPFSSNLLAGGGRQPYTWSLVGTTLPAGLSLNSSGSISGSTAATEGSYPQNLRVTDSRGRTATRTVQLGVVVPAPPSLSLSPDTLPNGTVNQPYSAGLSASGGTPGYTFSVSQGNLPPGLSLSGSSIGGTPTTEGTFRFGITVTDSGGRAAGLLYSVTIAAAVVPLAVTPDTISSTGQLGQPLSLQFGATGGKPPYSFSIGGNTPPGMGFNSSGLLSGTPSQPGSFSFSVTATDAAQATASKSYSLTVGGNLTITTQPPLAEGIVGTGYSVSFGASGGRPPYTFSISGSTPAGLSFDPATATLSGTPTAAGSSSFTVEVKDALQLSASRAFQIRIYDKLEITNAPSANPVPANQPYSFTFGTNGGKPPVTIGVVAGSLPPGLSMNSNGEVSGSPTTAGNFSFTVEATEALGTKATRAASIAVGTPLTVTTTTLPNGTLNVAYSASLGYTGGVPPVGAWGISQGSLPAGLSLAANGDISGTPTASGTSSFTVRITDAAGTAATRQLSITIALPPLPVVTINLPNVLPPGQQSNVTLNLASPFPAPVSGTITLIFEPNALNNSDDPAVQFSSGGRTVVFNIPAGQTGATFPVDPLRILSGTVAGAIRLRINTSPAPANPVPDSVVSIARGVPVITSSAVTTAATSFTLQLDGYSNTRELISGTFRLNPTAGAQLQTTDFTINLGQQFTSWYQSSASTPFGGQFRLAIPFDVQGALTDIESVTVTLTNSVGASQPVTVRLR